MLRRLFALATALCALVGPAAADFADLRAMAPIMPMGKNPMVFIYTSPNGGFVTGSPVLYGPSEILLNKALFGADAIEPMTGIDFGHVNGVLYVGDPPYELTVLSGDEGFVAGTAEALRARAFEESQVDGFPVFAMGQDYGNDVVAAKEPDPLGRSMAKSQRLAIADDFLLRATGWKEMNGALDALTATPPSAESAAWDKTIAAIETVCSGCWLNAATGWQLRAFVGNRIDVGTMLNADALAARLEQAREENNLRLPPFSHAVMAMTQDGTSAYVHIALPYDDAATARSVADVVGRDLVYFPMVPQSPRVDIVEDGQITVAVLTLSFPLGNAALSRDLFSDFVTAVMQRRFAPLDITAF